MLRDILGKLSCTASSDAASRASGGIGRRAGFRCQCPKGRGGSTPPSRTNEEWAPDRGPILVPGRGVTAEPNRTGSLQGRHEDHHDLLDLATHTGCELELA